MPVDKLAGRGASGWFVLDVIEEHPVGIIAWCFLQMAVRHLARATPERPPRCPISLRWPHLRRLAVVRAVIVRRALRRAVFFYCVVVGLYPLPLGTALRSAFAPSFLNTATGDCTAAIIRLCTCGHPQSFFCLGNTGNCLENMQLWRSHSKVLL